jgi:DNA-binding SARP family transcriptional activator
MSRRLTFSVLGPFCARQFDQPVDLGPPRQQAILAALVLRPGELIGANDLLDEVWDDPPSSGTRVLPPYIYRLRRLLRADDDPSGTRIIGSRAGGYRLEVADVETDLVAFDGAVARARALFGGGDPAAAFDAVNDALVMWRGTPLVGLPGPFAAQQRAALKERHLDAVELRFACELATGQHARVVGELTNLAGQHPTRETITELLMRAMYGSGRQADALEVFAASRTLLSVHCGRPPGRRLRDLQHAILRGDRDLAMPGRIAQFRFDLPRDPRHFTGRNREVHALVERGRHHRFATIDGMAGAGKTALAVHVAHQLRRDYPDGWLFVDLHAYEVDHVPIDTDQMLAALLRGAGVRPEAMPDGTADRLALWNSLARARRLLLVLDSVSSWEQIEPVVDGDMHGFVLVTGRRPLGDPDAVTLGPLTQRDGERLLASLSGLPASDPGIGELVARCGGLPLAISVCAERLRHRPTWTASDLSNRLSDDAYRLDELSVGDHGVARAFEASYRALDAGSRRVLQRAAALSAVFDVDDVHAVTGEPEATLSSSLATLVHEHLLIRVECGYRFHPLVRDFAAALPP